MTTVRINFLPRSYQPPKQLGLKEWAAAAGVAVVMVATTVYYMSMFASTKRFEGEFDRSQMRHQAVKTKLAEATDLRAREERVAHAEGELNSLAGHRWSSVLITLSDLTPARVTWTNLTVERNGLRLMGTAGGLVDVAQLFGGLLNSSGVEAVTLKYVNEKGVPVAVTARSGEEKPTAVEMKGIPLLSQLEFEMTITLVRPERGLVSHGT